MMLKIFGPLTADKMYVFVRIKQIFLLKMEIVTKIIMINNYVFINVSNVYAQIIKSNLKIIILYFNMMITN